MKRLALFGILILLSAIMPGLKYTGLPYVPVVRADPALSGATMFEPGNGSFSGAGLGDVGTPPTNHNFSTAGGSTGSPPTNYDLASGTFSNWTLTGSPTIQGTSPAYFARLGSGQKMKSDAFTVASDAQTLTVQTSAASGNYSGSISIYSGGSYATKTSTAFSCTSSCTTWKTFSANAVTFQGQSIKIEVERSTGTVEVDNVGIGQVIVSGWTMANGTNVSLETSGGPDGNFVSTTKAITSAPFVVDGEGQNGSISLRATAGSFSVDVLSGGSYGTRTTVFTGNSTSFASWTTKKFGIGELRR